MTTARFARLFQFDPVHPGSDAQQTAAMKALVYEFDTAYDALNWRLATAVKAIRPCVFIGFHTGMLAPALSSPAYISINKSIDIGGILWFLPHELGHLIEHYLLSDQDKEWFKGRIGRDNWGMLTQEIFADSFREWKNMTGWDDMTQILVPLRFPSLP